ncbi:MAG TPA: metallopeptidase family protein, partial [Kineosporiaceae bacterium]|nr:metallopeptidase family protein [Kineosporiaceae bacterium]
MSREQFEDAVAAALDAVPPELARLMDNVVVLVEDDAPDGDPDLLGLYEGTPLTERDSWWAAGSLPDRITVFRRPTLAACDTVDEVVDEVRVTVV